MRETSVCFCRISALRAAANHYPNVNMQILFD